ncbi:hypothetical protein EEL31_09210 [Brevibacillus laterosporus]|nr:hypothetical protein [Brevibacillus laterosporus]TPG68685.1 hypothetical protein EEL31_09210 [Brevibacillus laterosporus]
MKVYSNKATGAKGYTVIDEMKNIVKFISFGEDGNDADDFIMSLDEFLKLYQFAYDDGEPTKT